MNLCNGGSGCCGSGMHTPGTNGEYLGLDGEILFRNIWDWLVKYGLNWIIWEYVLYCLVTLRWSRIHRLWPKGWHVREVAILGPDLQGCFIYLILLMMEWPWISQSPPYIYVSTWWFSAYKYNNPWISKFLCQLMSITTFLVRRQPQKAKRGNWWRSDPEKSSTASSSSSTTSSGNQPLR